MIRNITIQLLDANSVSLAFKNIINNSNSLQIAVKSELMDMIHENRSIDWKQIIIRIEEL